MARFNEILVGRFNRALQKAFGIKGGAVTPQLGSEVMPGVVFPLGAEFRYLESWMRYGLSFAPGAAAGNSSAFRMRNPSTSNVVAVVEKLAVSNINSAVTQINVEGWAPIAADLGTILTAFSTRFDARGNQQPSMLTSEQNTPSVAGIGNTIATIVQAPNSGFNDFILDEGQELTLLPGDAFQVRSITANNGFLGFVWWRERFLEDSERF